MREQHGTSRCESFKLIILIIKKRQSSEMSTFRLRAASAEAPCRSPEWRQSSHHAGFDVLAHALRVVVVVVVVVGAARRGVEGRDAVKVEHEVFPVAHRRVALIARNAHCRGNTGGHHTCAS